VQPTDQPRRCSAQRRHSSRQQALATLADKNPSPAAIVLRPDRTSIRADAQDISNLEVNLVAKDGVLVPNSDRLISFDAVGAGRLIGTDNGDLRSLESYRSPHRTTRWGRCLAVVQSSRSPGTITVRGTGEGLPPVTVVLSTAAGS
jgi:beta-galactosidase